MQLIIQTLQFIPSDPESSIRILPINWHQVPRSRKPNQTYAGAFPTFCLAEFESFLQHITQNTLSQLEKNGSAIFQSRPRVKIELTRENGKKTSNTGSKGYVWLLVQRIQQFAWEIHASGWVIVSIMFCNRLSYIEHTISRANTQNFQRKDIL